MDVPGMKGAAAERVRVAFRDQAHWCDQLGSPFTAMLMRVLAECIDDRTATGRTLLEWPGEVDAKGAAIPLRLAGGLHALARSGRAIALTAIYPPKPLPSVHTVRETVAAALEAHDDELRHWLDFTPQTNEVGRSALLYPGLMRVADITGLPLSLFEIGSSAGLNLNLDCFGYTLGTRRAGDHASIVQLRPQWQGPDPSGPEPLIVQRRGCDQAPLDMMKPFDRERLNAYVWPDQTERQERLAGAITIAMANPPTIDRSDAADWIERHIGSAGEDGVARVLMHSITWQYLPAPVQERITKWMDACGRAATKRSPLAWLAFELHAEQGQRLTLRTWPRGEEQVLATAQAHGTWINWHGA
jgi:hypothetical protein